MRYLALKAGMTAEQILKSGAELVISSYEFVEVQFRYVKEYYRKLAIFKLDGGEEPDRFESALFSSLWFATDRKIKRLVLDEAHKIKREDGARLGAVLALPCNARIPLTASYFDNRWLDCAVLVTLIKGHPFRDVKRFVDYFDTSKRSGKSMGLTPAKMDHLVLLMKTFTIARPRSVLEVPGEIRYRYCFRIGGEELRLVDHFWKKYNHAILAAKIGRYSMALIKRWMLNAMVEGQLATCHRLLVKNIYVYGTVDLPKNNSEDPILRGDPDADYYDKADMPPVLRDVPKNFKDARVQWLEEIRKRGNLTSDKVEALVRLFVRLRRDFPDKKIVTGSKWVLVLDLFALGVLRKMKIKAFRYDGAMTVADRDKTLEHFKASGPETPILVSSDAVGLGIDMSFAGIIIIDTDFINANAEEQLVGRLDRPGQDDVVVVIKLTAENSHIERLVFEKQQLKYRVVAELRRRIEQRHDKLPIIPPVHPIFRRDQYEIQRLNTGQPRRQVQEAVC